MAWGGACRWGRGLLLRLAQETGRGGRSLRLPVRTCLLLAGAFNPGRGRESGRKTPELDLQQPPEQSGAEEGADGGADCGEDAKAAAFLEGS